MITVSWKLDDSNSVTMKRGIWGGIRMFVNGREVARKTPWKSCSIPFALEDGRKAELIVTQTGFVPEAELRIDGQVVLSDSDKNSISCLKCGTASKAGGKFCEKCGAALPDAENHLRMKKLKESRNAIAVVGAMFLVFGVLMYFMQQSNLTVSMKNLEQFKDSDMYPRLVAGKQISVGELKQMIQKQPITTLVTNIVLAVLMFALFLYSKKSPLAAIMIATGIYASVHVLNAIADPMTISQGLVMKIIMMAMLIKGIRATLELRKVSV